MAPTHTSHSTETQGSYTSTRSPQYNNDNESQAQRASTSSANDGRFALRTESDPDSDDHRTISRYSSGEDSSNTETTTETMTGPGPAPIWTAPPAATLTESTLDTHQMHARPIHPVFGWLAEEGPCDRVLRHGIPSRPASSARAVGDASSKQSTAASSINLDNESAPSLTNDIFGVGAWCRRHERK